MQRDPSPGRRVAYNSPSERTRFRQSVRGSVRAVRAVRNTRVFQTEIRVVADDVSALLAVHWHGDKPGELAIVR